jgi:hypothetical protein
MRWGQKFLPVKVFSGTAADKWTVYPYFQSP